MTNVSEDVNGNYIYSDLFTSNGIEYIKDELERYYTDIYGNVHQVGSCSAGTYTKSKVRLLSYVEAYNLEAKYEDTDLIYGNTYMGALDKNNIYSWYVKGSYRYTLFENGSGAFSSYLGTAGILIPNYYVGWKQYPCGTATTCTSGLYFDDIGLTTYSDEGVIVRPVIVINK